MMAPKARSVASLNRADAPASVASFDDSKADAFSEEVRLLERAQRARALGQCELALRFLAEYARRFPSGALKSESIGAEVLCLCELGRTTEAKALAHRLVASEPQSALARRLLASCVGPFETKRGTIP
jgi:hypothetical protein